LDQQVRFVHQFVHHLADPDFTQRSQMLSNRPRAVAMAKVGVRVNLVTGT